jgi:hypothetical protein
VACQGWCWCRVIKHLQQARNLRLCLGLCQSCAAHGFMSPQNVRAVVSVLYTDMPAHIAAKHLQGFHNGAYGLKQGS